MLVIIVIGDTPYKGFTPGELVLDYFAWPDGHSQVFMADLIIPDPECISVELQPCDEFLILASDGLWDVVSKPEAVRRVRASFDEGKPPETVSHDLCELAIRLGSSDNVTVVVVQFVHMR
ncbi:unnamed protein product [Symbiodinium microadriaticum]|nr:unnamed protein product [Symbiodinium microadriaticum]